jgi:NitT/TauT family transport system substrate-binding protein
MRPVPDRTHKAAAATWRNFIDLQLSTIFDPAASTALLRLQVPILKALPEMRPRSLWIMVLASAALALAGCSRQAPAAARIVVQLDWVAEPEHGGFYEALAKGYFRDAGLDVVLNQGGPNAFVMQKVATGQADIGQADSTNTLIAISQGLPLVNIAAIFQNDPSVLMLHADNPVRTFEDLNGKTIMARPEWAFIPYLKNKYHITFNLIPQNFEVGNFIADRNFIQQGFFTAEPYYIVKGGAKYPKFLYAWDAGFDAYTIVFANKAWAEQHAVQLKAFLLAYVHGWKDYIEGDPAPAQQMMLRLNSNNTPEFLEFSRKMIIDGKLVTGHDSKDDSQIGRISRDRFALQILQLEELGILPKGRLTADKVMTTAYLP